MTGMLIPNKAEPPIVKDAKFEDICKFCAFTTCNTPSLRPIL